MVVGRGPRHASPDFGLRCVGIHSSRLRDAAVLRSGRPPRAPRAIMLLPPVSAELWKKNRSMFGFFFSTETVFSSYNNSVGIVFSASFRPANRAALLPCYAWSCGRASSSPSCMRSVPVRQNALFDLALLQLYMNVHARFVIPAFGSN